MAAIAQQGAACAQALATPELLEAILLEADPKTILLAQRVDTSFCDTIKDSFKIQERLFFRAPAMKPNDYEDNPLLFGDTKHPDGSLKHFIPSSTLDDLGLGLSHGFSYCGGQYSPTVRFTYIDIKRCEESLECATASFLDMRVRQGTEEQMWLQVWNQTLKAPNWGMVQVMVKPQIFRNFITMAMSLQELAEYVTKLPRRNRGQWNSDNPNDKLDSVEWTDFFAMEQIGMIASPAHISYWDY